MKTEPTATQSTVLTNLWLQEQSPGVKFISLFSPWKLKGRNKSKTIKKRPRQELSPWAKRYLRSHAFPFLFFREPERWEWSEWGERNIQRDDASDWTKGQTRGLLRGAAHKRKGWRPALWKLHILQGLSAEQDVSRPKGRPLDAGWGWMGPGTPHALTIPLAGSGVLGT